jgi:exodeoxyribonuclease-5
MDRSAHLRELFLNHLQYEATDDQLRLFSTIGEFLTGDDGDILVVNGYAGTGKTTAVSAVLAAMKELNVPCVLLAPTGRSAKVLSQYSGMPASTIHKHIYRQSSMGADGMGRFTLSPNKARGTLFVVDEVSLIGTDLDTEKAMFGSGNLLQDLIQFLRNGTDCRMIMLGDDAQLPPVGLDVSPALSPDYMSGAGGVRFERLSEVVRQQAGSGILRNATSLRTMIADGAMLRMKDLGLETSADVVRIGGGELIDTLSEAYSRYGEDRTVVLCRSNRRANRYNAGIRAQVLFREERLVREDRLMVVKNCYYGLNEMEDTDYIANGDIARILRVSKYEERYGFQFAEARLAFPDYGDQELVAKILLDTLEAEAPALTYEQARALYEGVSEDYSHLRTKKQRYDAVHSDPFFNALQIKYAHAITAHKSQGGQWDCVFIDNPFWQEEVSLDDLKWLYTAITRATECVYLVNFKDEVFTL